MSVNPRDIPDAVRWIPPQPFGGSLPGGDSAPNRRVDLPSAYAPAAGDPPVDEIQEADISAGASANVLTFQIPDTYTLRVAGIGWGAEDESGLRFLSWSLFTDPPGIPFYPYVNKPAAIGSIEEPSPIFLCIGSSALVRLVATNNSSVPVAYHYFARMVGWMFRERMAS